MTLHCIEIGDVDLRSATRPPPTTRHPPPTTHRPPPVKGFRFSLMSKDHENKENINNKREAVDGVSRCHPSAFLSCIFTSPPLPQAPKRIKIWSGLKTKKKKKGNVVSEVVAELIRMS